jgi:hypothetical protein
MFEEDAIWRIYIAERQDREKISQAENIYQNYKNRLKGSFNRYFNFLEGLSIANNAIVIDVKDDFKRMKASDEYEKIKNINLHTMTPELYINFKDDDTANAKFEIMIQKNTDNHVGLITIYDSRGLRQVANLKNDIIDMKNFHLGGKNYYDVVQKMIDHAMSFFNFLELCKNDIIHETIHFLDKNYMMKDLKIRKHISTPPNSDYYNDVYEVNAHLLTRLFKYDNIDTLEEFIKQIKNENGFNWLGELDEKNRRKVLKRIYDFYTTKNRDLKMQNSNDNALSLNDFYGD